MSRSGPEKAAVILLALGADHPRLWESLDEEEIKEISQAMAALGTVASAVKLLRARGAASVRIACVHPVMAPKAFQVLDTPDLDEIVFTDSLPLVHGEFKNVKTTVLSIAPMLGDAMHRIHTGGSVGALFR